MMKPHHEMHFGEEDFVEEDVEHIMETFCTAVSDAATRRKARRETPRQGDQENATNSVHGRSSASSGKSEVQSSDKIEFTFAEGEQMHIEIGLKKADAPEANGLDKSFNSWDKDEGGIVICSVKPESKVPRYAVVPNYFRIEQRTSFECDTTEMATVKLFLDTVKLPSAASTIRLRKVPTPSPIYSENDLSNNIDLDLIENLVLNVA